MKKIDETKQLVRQGFFEVLATGKPPTVDLLIAWLEQNGHGTRRRNDISAANQACWEDVGSRFKQNIVMPGIPTPLVGAFNLLWDTAIKQAKEEFDADLINLREASDQAIEAANTLAVRAEQNAETMRGVLEELRVQYDGLQKAHAALQDKHTVLTNESNDLRSSVKLLEQTVGHKDSEISRLTNQAVLEAEIHRENLNEIQARATEAQKNLLLQIDEHKTRAHSLGKNVTRLEDQIAVTNKTSKEREAHLNDELTAANVEIGRAKGAIETKDSEIAQLWDRINEKDTAIAVIRDERAALQGRLEVIELTNKGMLKLLPRELRSAIEEAYEAGRSNAAHIAVNMELVTLEKITANFKKKDRTEFVESALKTLSVK